MRAKKNFCSIVNPVIAEWKILIDKLLENEKIIHIQLWTMIKGSWN